MQNFRLVFAAQAGLSAEDRLSIEASDAAAALLLAQRHGSGRPAELWRGDQLLCRLAEDTSAGFWEIG